MLDARPILDRPSCLDYTLRFDSVQLTGLRGEFFAETHVSTESAPPPQDPRISRAHEDQRGPQGAGGPTQKRTPSSHTHLEKRTCPGVEARLPDGRANRGLGFPAPCAS
jgi:hypothetical protein